MSTTNLEPFDLAAALAGRKTVTRDRKRVLAIWDSGLNIPYPIAAIIDDGGDGKIRSWGRDGKFHEARDTVLDFFHPPAWRLPDPPPGKKWHRDDWTEEMLPEGWRPLLYGEECLYGDMWLDSTDGRWKSGGLTSSPITGGIQHTRTRRPLPPVKKRLTLGPEDAPPLSVLRWKSWAAQGAWVAALQVHDGGVLIGATTPKEVTWTELMDDYEILRPGSDWQPCWKEVDA